MRPEDDMVSVEDWRTLDGYQRAAAKTDVDQDASDPIIPLLGLAGEIGALIAEFKKKKRADGRHHQGFDDSVAIEIGDMLWYLAALARRIERPLSEIAEQNLVKTRSRWLNPSESSSPSFDSAFPTEERFPREFYVTFEVHDSADGLAKTRMLLDGQQLGDVIDDNAAASDGYRFHDAFHLAYVAVLGWSPVIRSLMKRKRKSQADIDRTEDGARAKSIEEAISAFIFEMSKEFDFFEGVHRVDDFILETVQAMTRPFEVKIATAAEWESTILQGFEAWRQLKEHNGGKLRMWTASHF